MGKALKVRVKVLARSCRQCPIRDVARQAGLCSLCCSLVVDRDGQAFVCSILLDGDDWQQVDGSRLSPAPRLLEVV